MSGPHALVVQSPATRQPLSQSHAGDRVRRSRRRSGRRPSTGLVTLADVGVAVAPDAVGRLAAALRRGAQGGVGRRAAAAVDVGLGAVLDAVRARRRGAHAVTAARVARAVAAGLAVLAVVALRRVGRRGAAAIDVALGSVLEPVRRRRAQSGDAALVLAVRRDAAGLAADASRGDRAATSTSLSSPSFEPFDAIEGTHAPSMQRAPAHVLSSVHFAPGTGPLAAAAAARGVGHARRANRHVGAPPGEPGGGGASASSTLEVQAASIASETNPRARARVVKGRSFMAFGGVRSRCTMTVWAEGCERRSA